MELKDLAIELFKQFDPENKGYITQEQLLNSSNDGSGSFSYNQISYIFSLLDKENKGVITLTDFTDAFIGASDSNKDLQNILVEDAGVNYDNYDNLHVSNNGSVLDCENNSENIREYSMDQHERNVEDINRIDILNLEMNNKGACEEKRTLEERRDSLPLILESLSQSSDNLDFQEWRSCNNGIDFLSIKLPSKSKNLNRNISNRCNSLDRNLIKRKSSDSIRKEFDEIFNTAESFTCSKSCRASFEDISKGRLSVNTFNGLTHSLKRSFSQTSNLNKSFDENFVLTSARNSLSLGSLSPNSSSSEDMLYVEEFSNEEWESYLRRIGGVALFGGNQVLHYIWQQINSYQKSILLPLEDFLKGIIEEHKAIYTKYQDIESALHLKIAQQELELDNIYEECERLKKEDQVKIDKKHMEREELLKTQFRNALDLKEQICQENIKNFIESNEKLKTCEEEISKLIHSNEKLEDQCQQLFKELQVLCSTIEVITKEKEFMEKQLLEYEENNRELHEVINQVTQKSEKEREKYNNFFRQFKDMLEEKEFLEVSLSNLSFENYELKNVNSILKKEDHIYMDELKIKFSEKFLPLSSSPRNKDFVINRFSSLHEDMAYASTVNKSVDLYQDPEINYKSLCSELEEHNDDIQKRNLTDAETPLNVKYLNGVKDGIHLNLNDFEKSSDEITNLQEQLLEPLVNSSLMDNKMDNKVEIKSEYAQEPTNHIRLACTIQSEFKVIFCGDCSVGKTSLIHRICFNEFLLNRQQTMRLDTYSKTVNLKENSVKLILWDTCGQERFNSLPRSYYRKSDVVVLVYDLTEENSFVNAKSWFSNIHDLIEDNTLLVLVANKKDLSLKRAITTECGALLAKDNDAMFIEASSKSNENIYELIELIATTLLQREDTVIIRNDVSLLSLGAACKERKKENICC